MKQNLYMKSCIIGKGSPQKLLECSDTLRNKRDMIIVFTLALGTQYADVLCETIYLSSHKALHDGN